MQGQANAQSDTAAGKVKAIATSIEDQAAAFGNKYANAIQIGATALGGLGGAYKVTKGLIDKHNAAQAEAAAGAEEAAGKAGLLSRAMEALGGVIGGAATSRGRRSALTSPRSSPSSSPSPPSATILWQNWGTIWPAIKRYAVDAIDYSRGSWVKLIAAIEGIPAALDHIGSIMWKGIANAFVDMINFVIHAWNGLQFTIPSVGFGPFHTPSFTLGLPNIPDVPHLAQGGLITSDGLVYAHAGEAITPRRGGSARPSPSRERQLLVRGRRRPGVHARRAAWVVQTARI